MQKTPRQCLIDWHQQNELTDLDAGFRVTQIYPDSTQWQSFIERLLLISGGLFLLAGLMFFFAFNWELLGRFEKFALIELIFLGLLIFYAFITGATPKTNDKSLAPRATLLGLSVTTGILLALIGQTYQTGADTYELFVVWSLLILPWALLSRCSIHWIFWLALVNTAISLYVSTFHTRFWFHSHHDLLLWLSISLNFGALIFWEWLRHSRGIEWLQSGHGPRLLATAVGVMLTFRAIEAVFDHRLVDTIPLIIWCCWMAAMYCMYRLKHLDVFMLSGICLSAIIIITAILIRIAGEAFDFGGLIFIAVAIIAMSAYVGRWLKGLYHAK